ncbi:MAG TPA: GNAT family N-acetyltransferase [Gemmatimonadales bacterium]|nr:GNAT family N-acetyltransferase [Gemmatimonadales bacterium]
MWRRDKAVRGPERPGLADIDPLNRVFSQAFTDRYRRDGMPGVRVPHLNPDVWRFALESAGDGAMVWRDGAGEIVAFNLAHRSGLEGWMGPLAVRPDRQGEGLGKEIVHAGVAWLQARGARTIGLETMPRTVENIGFYSRLGFLPGHLTVTVTRPTEPGSAAGCSRLSLAASRTETAAECAALNSRVAPGVDFGRELALTADLGLGDTTLYRRDGALAAYALWHAAPLALGRPREDLRVLKLVAADLSAMHGVLAGVVDVGAAEGTERVTVRCETRHEEAYAGLLAGGWQTHWTDLRMTLAGSGEAEVSGVLFSNWEI